MRRHTDRYAAPRPRAAGTLTAPRLLATVASAAGLLVTLSGSLTVTSANATAVTAPPARAAAPALVQAELARRHGTVGMSGETATSAVIASTSAIATREQGAIRAQRAQHQREAIAERTAQARAKAKALAAARRWVSPVKRPELTSGFGHRWGRLHAGLDFRAPVGTPLRSMSSGTVTKAGWGGGYGQKVEIRFWDGTVSFYAHMSSIAVKVGQRVTPGLVIGESGNTGHSTGPHLHLELHPGGGDPVDPRAVMAKRGIRF